MSNINQSKERTNSSGNLVPIIVQTTGKFNFWKRHRLNSQRSRSYSSQSSSLREMAPSDSNISSLPIVYKKSKSKSIENKDISSQKSTLHFAPKWSILPLLFLVILTFSITAIVIMGHVLSTSEVSNQHESSSSVVSKLKDLSSKLFFSHKSPIKKINPYLLTEVERHQLHEYECLGWRQTKNCTPDVETDEDREPQRDGNCSIPIRNGVSGYCEIQHRETGVIKHVLRMHCNSLRPDVKFTCGQFISLLSFELYATSYIHDTSFSFEYNQEELKEFNSVTKTPLPIQEDGVKNQSVGEFDLSFDRGIVMVVYEALLVGAYASIRSLRAMGCTLPVEIWYSEDELNPKHALLQTLVADYNVYLRVIKDNRARRFYTKLYAVFYSAFDAVLLLDADNFSVRDPTYLFETPQYKSKGAIFWPDYWTPRHTLFNIHKQSFVWDYFGLDFVDAFEQESGQVLINRRKHERALNVLMYYGFTLPRTFEDMRLVWGDKDLFRFAWMKVGADFHMIRRPPGSAGTKHSEYALFCGVTMVQHDPSDKVLFLHRNTEKLGVANARKVWTHIQQYQLNKNVKDFHVRGANGGKVFPEYKRCFGKDVHYEKQFLLTPVNSFEFGEKLEDDLLQYAGEAVLVMENAGMMVRKPKTE